MSKSSLKNKWEIRPENIKSNIYDYVKLVVDTAGITTSDIIKILPRFNALLPQEKYRREEGSLTTEEINEYADRQDNTISMIARKRYMEDTVIRYTTEDQREMVSIGRLFTSIYLSYDVTHSLKDSFEQIGKIIEILNTLDYFEVRKIYLMKCDSIYCATLDDLYHCFEKTMFADTAYECLQLKKHTEIDTGTVQVRNSFSVGDIDVLLNKTVMAGSQPDSADIIYRGGLETVTSMWSWADELNVEDCFQKLNRQSFALFLCHITDEFAQELVDGTSNYIMRGFNQNE